MPAVTVYLGLGSNLGDREGHLERGLAALVARGVHLTKVSSVYETEPVGGPAQGPYLNLVAAGETSLSPEALMQAALEAEAEAGRVRGERNAPRTLDVDLIVVGDRRSDDDFLKLPHPRARERAFVLKPWHDLEPDAVLPDAGPVADLLAAADQSGMTRRDDLSLETQ